MSAAKSGRRATREEERLVPGTPLWDAQYEEHRQRYAFAANWVRPGMRVLDAGCGVGYGAALLVDQGAEAVIAVDLSADALQIGRSRFARPGITWLQEDCQRLDEARKRGPFHLICSLENLEHLEDPDAFLRRGAEMLLPDGVLVVSTPNRLGANRLRGIRADAPSPNPFHTREYSTDEFRQLLSRYFEKITLHFQTIDPLERMFFEPALAAIWRDPLLRLGRWLRRRLGRTAVPEALEELLPPRKYQILERNPGDPLVITQLAVCLAPKGETA